LGAVRTCGDLHAICGLADAACRQNPLAFDLHHAGAAIAVRTVAGLGRVAQMRDVGAVPVRHLPDGLIGAGLDLAAIEGEFHALAHRITPLESVGWAKREARAHPAHHKVGTLRFAHPTATTATLRYQPPSGFFSSSGKYFSTLTSGFGA